MVKINSIEKTVNQFRKTGIIPKTFLTYLSDADREIAQILYNQGHLGLPTIVYGNQERTLIKKEISLYKKRQLSSKYRQQNKYKTILRKLRRVNTQTHAVYGATTVDGGFDDFEEVLKEQSVIAMNYIGNNQITEAIKILHNYNIIGINLIVSYIIDTDNILEGSFNPFWLDTSSEQYDQVLSLNISKFKVETTRFSITHLFDENKFLKLSIETLTNEIAGRIASVNALYCLTGFDILPASQAGLDFNSYANELRAFLPNTDQQFHRLTACSTTSQRLCIYETYYYLYVDNQSLIKKNLDNIKLELSKETIEIQKAIKNGELSLFLIEKSKELEIIMFVQFYKTIGDICGFSVDNGVINKITDINIFNKEKVFLYHNKHVAPCKNKNTVKKNELLERKKEKTFVLKPQKVDKEKPFEMVLGYDFETYRSADFMAHPFCLCLSNNVKFYGLDIVNQFCDYLETICTKVDITKSHAKKSVPKIMIYGFNNSRFDNIFIFEELVKRNPSLKYIILDSSIKMIQFHNIYIYDLSLYYAGSLKEVSSSFKLDVQKGVFPYTFPDSNNLNYIGDIPNIKYWNSQDDYNEYVKSEGLQFDLKTYCEKYCLLDSLLVKQIADKHLEQAVGEINGKKYDVRTAPTGAGLALKFFCQVFLITALYQSPEHIQKLECQAYKGGRTEVFKKEFDRIFNSDKLLYYYDLNSSYPSAMTFNMPAKYLRTLVFPKTITFKDKYLDNLIDTNIYYAKSTYLGNDPFFIPNLLSRSKENDIIATADTEWGYHWGIELREAIANGCEVITNKMLEYSTQPIFKKFAEYMYEERLKAKNTNTSRANFLKLVMNSLYGKFGQSLKTHNKMCSSCADIHIIASNPIFKITGYEIVGDNILLKYVCLDDETTSIGSLVRFASYITAVARTNLAIIMRDIGHEHIYYCDTDSIFTDKKPSDKFIDQSRLGAWKLETKKVSNLFYGDKYEIPCHIIKARFLAPKTYFYKSDTTIFDITNDAISLKAKGQPNHKLEEHHFHDVTQNKKVVITNDAMFFRKLNSIHIKPQTRELQAVYNKRIWDGNNSSPFKTFSDWHIKKYDI